PSASRYSASFRSGPVWGSSISRNSRIERHSRDTHCKLSRRLASRNRNIGLERELTLIRSVLELDDIQSGVLRPRPTPYAAAYVLFRIDNRKAGRDLMRRLRAAVVSTGQSESSDRDTWVSVALSYQGLKALGVPESSLQSFSPEFQQGMAARAKSLGDNDESSPEHWEQPLGSTDVHVVVAAVAPSTELLEAAFERARKSYQEL